MRLLGETQVLMWVRVKETGKQQLPYFEKAGCQCLFVGGDNQTNCIYNLTLIFYTIRKMSNNIHLVESKRSVKLEKKRRDSNRQKSRERTTSNKRHIKVSDLRNKGQAQLVYNYLGFLVVLLIFIPRDQILIKSKLILIAYLIHRKRWSWRIGRQ